ncbi:MAG: radical SAM protein [Candidatus Omnitrophica bacterium]|nr:radical SAM protein [Candidatus Omnitrophota bacterium]MCG2703622.1 radical SAM protein [Candidatus Omnitrophota bacterium]
MEINAGKLKLDLYCRGIKIDPAIHEEKIRKRLRVRGGLGSGVEVILPHNIWVNIPVFEKFVMDSPYELKEEKEEFYIYKNSMRIVRVDVAKTIEFYHKKTSEGNLMREIGIMHGGALAFYLGPRCEFWATGQNCRFCAVGLNVGLIEKEEKSIGDVVEVAREAFREGVADFIHINTGYSSDESCGIKTIIPYVKALKQAVNASIAIQTLPPRDNKWIDFAYEAGADSVSFNFEFWGASAFNAICPGKSLKIGQQRFLDAIKYAVKIFPNGSVAGEIIAGLEPIEETMRAIDFITAAGALPIVCVFRPVKGTLLEHEKSPDPEKLAPIFEYMYRQCNANGVRMNLVDKVSLVIMPIEGRFFAQK